MEQLTQHTQTAELKKSFDPLASVDMYRFDLQRFGHILPETHQRVYDEELSYIAEGIDRPLQTSFVLAEKDGQYVYFDRGEWRPYLGSLTTGLIAARAEAALDSRKQFLAERAAYDLQKGYEMLRLQPNQQLAWASPFPEMEANKFGDEFIAELGFQPTRHRGFLYLATRQVDGSLLLQSQSVDNSNQIALDRALALSKAGPTTIDAMRVMYDRQLGLDSDIDYYAGQDKRFLASTENVWTAITRHRDLLEFYFSQITILAGRHDIARNQLEHDKKRLTYSVWAALKERLDKDALPLPPAVNGQQSSSIYQEVEQSYQKLSKRGEVLSGCGGAISSQDSLMDASAEDVFSIVFGDKDRRKETWQWKSGVCRVSGCPTRPGKTRVGPCAVCVSCQRLFDKGQDPADVYRQQQHKQNGSTT